MRNGFVAPDEEAAELLEAAAGDATMLDGLVERRLTGEPLAWITGKVEFCGLDVAIHEGVYVPRWHTELVAERAAERLPEHGAAIDLCTGSGAIAKVLNARRPQRAGDRERPRRALGGVRARERGRRAPRRSLRAAAHRSRRRDRLRRAVRPDARAAAPAARHVHVRVRARLRRRGGGARPAAARAARGAPPPQADGNSRSRTRRLAGRRPRRRDRGARLPRPARDRRRRGRPARDRGVRAHDTSGYGPGHAGGEAPACALLCALAARGLRQRRRAVDDRPGRQGRRAEDAQAPDQRLLLAAGVDAVGRRGLPQALRGLGAQAPRVAAGPEHHRRQHDDHRAGAAAREGAVGQAPDCANVDSFTIPLFIEQGVAASRSTSTSPRRSSTTCSRTCAR